MSLQEALRKLETSFNVNECHILQIGIRNQKFKYEVNAIKFVRLQCVKDLGITIALSLKFFQQCKDVTRKANRMKGFNNRNFSFCISAKSDPHLEYAVQFCSLTIQRI